MSRDGAAGAGTYASAWADLRRRDRLCRLSALPFLVCVAAIMVLAHYHIRKHWFFYIAGAGKCPRFCCAWLERRISMPAMSDTICVSVVRGELEDGEVHPVRLADGRSKRS
jgi:hypothetical protein